MPLDPQAQELLTQMEAAGFPPLHELTAAEARDHVNALPLGTGPEVRQVEDLFIAVPDHSRVQYVVLLLIFFKYILGESWAVNTERFIHRHIR